MQFSEAGHYFMAICALAAGTLIGWTLHCRFAGRRRSVMHKGRPGGESASTPPDGADIVAPPARSILDRSEGAVRRAGRQASPCVRNTFLLALDRHLPEAARRGESLSMVLVCAENFRGASDPDKLRLAGETLEAAGKVFIDSVRSNDWVARFDATTFAFLLPGALHEGALIMAERLRRKISIAALPGSAPPARLTLSIGTTDFVPGDDSASIMHRVEEALHAAIEAGGNCIRSRLGDRLETPAKGDLLAAC